MFKYRPKFNKKDGEDRVCKECGVTFHTMKPINTCRTCINEKSKAKSRAEGKGGHKGRTPDLEGITFAERKSQWDKKAKWIQKNLNERSEWQEYFRKELQRISEDEKLWASLTRDTLGQTPTKEEREEGKLGRPSHKDTQWMTWEEYEAGGWGGDIDS